MVRDYRDAGVDETLRWSEDELRRLEEQYARDLPWPKTVEQDIRGHIAARNPPPGHRPTMGSGPDVSGLSDKEAAQIRAMWQSQVEQRPPTAAPGPVYSGETGQRAGSMSRKPTAPGDATQGGYELFGRRGASKRPSAAELGVKEADPVVGSRRVSLEGLGFEKLHRLQKELGAAARGLNDDLLRAKPGSPEAASLERQLIQAQKDASDMARLARSVGTTQGKRFEPGAPESHALLRSKTGTYPEVETAARTIEGYQRTGKVASPEQMAQMKIDIERGLTAGTDQNEALVATVGKKMVTGLSKKRDALIAKHEKANAAIIKDTGQPVTGDMIRSPQNYNLGPYAMRALNDARKATLKFDNEMAQMAIRNLTGLVGAARTAQGGRKKLTAISTRTPEAGEKIEQVEQLFRKPGAKTTARGKRPGGGRGLNAMQKRVRNYYKDKIHKDAQASRKKEGFIGWDTFIVYANPSMAQYQTLHDAIIGTDKKRPTSKQKKAAEAVKAVLRDRYDKKVGAAKTAQTDFRTRQQIKTENKLKLDNNNFTNKIERDIKRAKTAQDKQKLQHVLDERLYKIKHNIKVLPWYKDRYLQTKFGEIKKVREGKAGTPVDVPEIPAGEPTGEGPAPEADPKLAAAVSAVEKAILPKDKETKSDYMKRVGPLYKKVAAMRSDAAQAAASRLKNLMNTNMPNE